VVASIEIVEHDSAWPDAFRDAAEALRGTLGAHAVRIDHIGSTAVPGLASKDVIDLQLSVAADGDLAEAAAILETAGWVRVLDVDTDHPVLGWADDGSDNRKVLFIEPAGSRRMNLHVRAMNRPNQRYPLLVRDYLRAHPYSAWSYATLKKDLAVILSDDRSRYADVKDAACDLIYFAAEDWAAATGWDAGKSDA
jgi:GrpB-like predicted nucleotidyltransferase (UPF0157 family)